MDSLEFNRSFNSRHGQPEERISEIKDRSFQVIQSEVQKKKKKKKE